MRKSAFTLAEVLITLSIIGIIAAITLPSLIQKNNNKVVEARLQKFYSTINQALNSAEVIYGDKKFWKEIDTIERRLASEGMPIGSLPTDTEYWVDKYIVPNMKIIKKEEIANKNFIYYFPDGSAMSRDANVITTLGWIFYPGNPKKCIKRYGIEGGLGICKFVFEFMPEAEHDSATKYHANKGMEPARAQWDGDSKTLYDSSYLGCNPDSTYKYYCTAIIQDNGWKIPDDYPFKVSY